MDPDKAPIKTVTMTGNFSEDFLEYIPYPQGEFSRGRWNLSVGQIIIDSTSSTLQNDTVIGISCNFVKNDVYNSSNEIVSEYSPLKIFLVKKKALYQKEFDQTWILTNNCSDSFRIFPVDLEKKTKVKIDCKVTIQILFQRIK
jgi:hypothetical protein